MGRNGVAYKSPPGKIVGGEGTNDLAGNWDL
jgi:hypothetical protein